MSPRTVLLAMLSIACTGSSTPESKPESESESAQTATKPAKAARSSWLPHGTPPARNTVLIVLDTTRDDATRAARTPTLDRLESQGARVDRAWSGGTWTVPSVVSLLTGRLVRHHGWDLPSARMGKYPALPDVPRLPEVLQQQGVKTAALYANPYLSEPLGFDRGFNTWKRTSDRHMPKQLARIVQSSWTETDRHFVYLHLLGPHSPLRPSDAARERWAVEPHWFEGKHGFMVGEAKRNQKEGVRAAYKAAYHAAIEDTDALVNDLLTALGPHRDDTLVIVTSDHGELLGEHEQAGHGWWLYEELTRVPLIVDHPFVDGDVESLPPVLSNVSVADLVTQGMGVAYTWPVTLDDAPLLAARRDGREAVAFDGVHKVVWDDRITGTSPIEYNLDQDPNEQSPAPASEDQAVLLDALDKKFPVSRLSLVEPTPVDPDTVEDLKKLGYVDR